MIFILNKARYSDIHTSFLRLSYFTRVKYITSEIRQTEKGSMYITSVLPKTEKGSIANTFFNLIPTFAA
jgi:hypothetical protein